MRTYELMPIDVRKSFYNKAIVIVDSGDLTLLSYGTPIVRKNADGTLIRLFTGNPSMTTCRHIKAFCGLDKKQFLKLEV